MKARNWRALLARENEILQFEEWLAGDAVLTAPCSARLSLLTGNFTGKISNSGIWERQRQRIAGQIQALSADFPKLNNRELFRGSKEFRRKNSEFQLPRSRSNLRRSEQLSLSVNRLARPTRRQRRRTPSTPRLRSTPLP